MMGDQQKSAASAAAATAAACGDDPEVAVQTSRSLFREMETFVAEALPHLFYHDPGKAFRGDTHATRLVRCGNLAAGAARMLRLLDAKVRLGERYRPTKELEVADGTAEQKLKEFLIGTEISHEPPHECMQNALLLIKGNTLLFGGHVKEALGCARRLADHSSEPNFRK